MSCEGNRLKFFEQAQAALGLDAQALERVYQAGKAKGLSPEEEDRATQKTRWLFADMQTAGLKPPTHSADGLPKMAARAGYAAIFDYLRQNAPVKPMSPSEIGIEAVGSVWPLEIRPHTLLDHLGRNGEGFLFHRFCHNEGAKTGKHVWFGAKNDESEILGERPLWISNEELPKMKAFAQNADADGLLADGYAPEGFDRDGFDALGYSIYGLRREEMSDAQRIQNEAARTISLFVRRSGRSNSKEYKVDIEGYSPQDGFRPTFEDEILDCDRFGFNRLGFKGGRSWTGYDEKGLDAQGKPAPQVKGYDAWGYERKSGLTAPDAQGRRYNLIGWAYDPSTGECYDPQNPSRRMTHDGSFAYSPKWKKVILKRSYIPTKDEMQTRLRNPSIRWNEFRAGGGPLLPYSCRNDYGDEAALYQFNRPEMRYLRSEERLRNNPQAEFLGVPLRCPKCGQFTGAAPHLCPHFGNRRVLAMNNGTVIAFERGAYRPDAANPDYARSGEFGKYRKTMGDVYDDLMQEASTYRDLEILQDVKIPYPDSRRYLFYGLVHKIADLLWRKAEDETAIVLEAPHSPLKDFDPDYHGGPFPGYHWKSGLSREGYDPFGFHYLTGRNRQGMSRRSLRAMARLKAMLNEMNGLLAQRGKNEKDMLEVTYSRVATALAGAARRVTITEQGGPRPGMFSTDLRGRIQAERWPLQNTPQNSEINNLLAMKAGIYHELGHEEDTPVGIFARVMDIAHGREEVDGIPKEAAGLVAEVYNILEDGRMERAQAKRRRGTASILAADALINPRWDEKVGEGIPVSHQVMGMMLYRSLPFFRVREEVLAAAPERVRALYREVEPLVDRAMQSPQDAFQASVEITRRLIEGDEQIRRFAERMTSDGSQGGKWVFQPLEDGTGKGSGTVIIVSALPNLGGGAAPDRTLSLPPRGWGRKDEPLPSGRPQGKAGGDDEADGSEGRHPQRGQDDEADEADGSGGGGEYEAGSRGERQFVEPELDENFFSSIASHVSLGGVFEELAGDLRLGANAILRSPVGKALQKPLDSVGDIVLENPYNPKYTYRVFVLDVGKGKAKAKKQLSGIEPAARAEGRRVARRLEVLKEEIRKRVRLQTSGALDRKRFKRALAGAETVHRQMRVQDITSLAVSVQLDMSGSMRGQIESGKLAGAALALEEAFQRLDAEYMVTGFGTEYALIKSFGDERIREEQAAAMLTNDLGGTNAAPALRLGLLGLKETHSANKLHVVLTDGAFSDTEAAVAQAEEMRRNGIVPFGVFLKHSGGDFSASSLNRVFGKDGWVEIKRLSDLSEVVARRIEQIYRKILATR